MDMVIRSGRSVCSLVSLVVMGLVCAASVAGAQNITLTGSVTYTGTEAFPPAQVRVLEDGATQVGTTATLRTDGSFSVSVPAPLTTTSYTAELTAPCWSIDPFRFDLAPEETERALGTATATAAATDFTTIQLVGSFTGWNIGASPFMTLMNACAWSDTIALAVGDHAFKFVTDEDYDDPPSYADFSGMKHVLPGGPFNVGLFSGFGGDIQITAPVAGDYIFTLDESLQSFSVTLVGGAPTGSVGGTIAYTGLESPPYPAATVTLKQGDVTRVTSSNPTTGAYGFAVVAPGDYSVEITAACYTPETIASVTVGSAAVDLGTTTLDPGTSEFTSISFAGDFNEWNLTAAPMVQGTACVWTVVTEIPAGTFNSKFVTNNNFDNPLDYGGNESDDLAVPGTHPVSPASGFGSSFRFVVSETATFVVTLNEATQTVRFDLQTAVEPTTWGLIKAGYGN